MFQNKNIDFISDNALFKGVDVSELKNIINPKNFISVREGDIIFQSGDNSDNIFLIIDGEVKIKLPDVLNSPIIIKRRKKEFFGEREYIENRVRTSSAVANTDCIIYPLHKSVLNKVLSKNKQMVKNIYESNKMEEADLISDIHPEETPHSTIDLNKTTNKVDKSFLMEKEKTVESEGEKEEDKEQAPPEDENTGEEKNIPEEQNLNDLVITGDDVDINFDNLEDDTLPDLGDELSENQEDLNPSAEPDEITGEEDNIPAEESDHIEVPAPDKELEENQNMENELVEPEEEASLQDDEEYLNWDFSSEAADEGKESMEENINDFKWEEDPEVTDEPEDSGVEENKEEEPEPGEPAGQETGFDEDEDTVIDYDNADQMEEPDSDLTGPDLPDDSIDDDFSTEEEEEYDSAIPPVEEDENSFFYDPEMETGKSYFKEIENEPAESLSDSQTFEKLFEASQIIGTSIDLGTHFLQIPLAVKQLVNADAAVLYIVDPKFNQLRSTVETAGREKNLWIKLGEGIEGICAEKNEIINVKDTSSETEHRNVYDDMTGYSTVNMLCMPINNKTGRVIGVLTLLNHPRGYFSEDDELLLLKITPNIANALQNRLDAEIIVENERYELLGKLLSSIGEDIQNPILTIRHYAEHLQKKKLPNEIKHILSMLNEEAGTVFDLVQTMMSYSKGEKDINLEPKKFNEIIDNILNVLAEYVESRNVRLFKKLESDAEVMIDPRAFYQACFQITKNACDAMPDGGNLYVSSRLDKDNIDLVFRDEGAGIPESIIKNIFDPFASFGKEDVPGIGLSISQKIIDAHNGVVSVKSEVGEGSIFTISLPWAPKEESDGE